MPSLNTDQLGDGLLEAQVAKSTAWIDEVPIEDEKARENVGENQKWMLGGYINETHKKDVEHAFEIVYDSIEKSEGVNGDVEDMIAGPGVLWAFLGNLMTWTTFVVVTVASTFTVDVSNAGIAQKPKGIYMACGIVIWLAFTLAALIPEYKALMYCLPTQSVCVERKAEGKGAGQPFNRWMVLMFIISIGLHADIYTTAIFMGRVYVSVENGNTLNNLWKLAVCSSALENVPVINVLTYGQLCFIAWCLMISQVFYALAYSIPISPNVAKHMDVSTDRIKYAMAPDREHVQLYDTLLKKDTGHGRCLQALSESGRMCSLNWQDDAYLSQAERDWDCHRVHDEMRRTNVRFMLFCIQATFIPNLQITFLGIQKAHQMQIGEHATDYLTLISFTISVLCGLHYIYYEFGSVRRHTKYVMHAVAKEKEAARGNKNGRKHWEAHLIGGKALFSIASNYMFTLIFSGMFCFILVKAAMAIHFCDSGLWNVHIDFGSGSLMGGCVPMDLLPNLSTPFDVLEACPHNVTA